MSDSFREMLGGFKATPFDWPRLEAIAQAREIAVIFSEPDVSTSCARWVINALRGQKTADMVGLSPTRVATLLATLDGLVLRRWVRSRSFAPDLELLRTWLVAGMPADETRIVFIYRTGFFLLNYSPARGFWFAPPVAKRRGVSP